MRTCIAWMAAVAACWSAVAGAQTSAPYPAKPLRIIVPLAPGGNVDLVVRALAQQVSESLVPQVMVVNPALPVRTVKELIALAKSRPGELSYATSGAGGTGHMATELFSRQVGIRMLHVPYKGNAQAIVDVMGGQVMLMFDQVSTSEPHVKAAPEEFGAVVKAEFDKKAKLAREANIRID